MTSEELERRLMVMEDNNQFGAIIVANRLHNEKEQLLYENNRLKERIEYLERSIARKEETIDDRNNEIANADYTCKNLINANRALCKKLEEIKHILNNEMEYYEFVDMINAIEDVIKESDAK